jgi:hypothetical protein
MKGKFGAIRLEQLTFIYVFKNRNSDAIFPYGKDKQFIFIIFILELDLSARSSPMPGRRIMVQ